MTARVMIFHSTIVGLFLFSLAAFSANQVGKVVKTEGFAYKKKKEEKKFSLVSPRDPFYLKEPFKTGKKSLVVLQLDGGFQMKLIPQSEMHVTRGATSQSAHASLSLARGGIYLNTLKGGSTKRDRGFHLQLGKVSIKGSSGKIFVFRAGDESGHKIFLYSQNVAGKISHPFGKTQDIAAGEAYYIDREGSRQLAENKHKKWVKKLNWSFRGDMEPEDYTLEFPQVDK